MHSQNKLPVSIIICALNEEKRIKDTIESAKKNNPFEVIVVEGGSTDNTVQEAKKYTETVYSVQSFGLGYKRAFGVEKATQPYILTLDADQVLNENALSVMIQELTEKKYAGIQAQLKSLMHDTYWEKAMGYNVGLTHAKPRDSNIIGTPALFRAEILKENNFDKTITGSCDDTDLCYRLVKKGYTLGISSALCFQKHRSTFRSTYKKFFWYGEGDFVFGSKHPERMWSIFIHPIKNHFFIKSIRALLNRQIQYIPFFMFTGLVRHLGFYSSAIKMIRGKSSDSRLHNRSDRDY